jgi:hypothetical protein
VTSPKRYLVLTAILGALVACLILPQVGVAKTYPITGTVDCGVPSGQRCSIDDTVAIITNDLGGDHQRVEVDVSWIKKYFEEQPFDQDDPLCVEVDDQDGHFQALRANVTCDQNGTGPK